MTSAGLRTNRKHDLPPLWDDQPVQWQGWERPVWTTLALHLPLESLACRKCGNLAAASRNAGVVRPPGAGHPTRRLFATRCDCGHDQVYDLDTDELWDLEDSDYGDAGSVDPNQVQGALF